MLSVDQLPELTLPDGIFLAMIAMLPLHTVFFEAWISWKPWLVLLVVVIMIDLWEGIREREWPYHPAVSIALVVFAGVLLVGFPVEAYRERFFQLGLAIAVGAMVMLVTERRLLKPGLVDRMLTVVFWTGAAMGVTAIFFSLVSLGVFGAGLLESINDLPGVFRISKPAYLEEGFIALTNWHQDPGYGAAWSVLWACLALVAAARNRASGWRWVDATVIGMLGFAVVMAFSRTGWVALALGLIIAGFALTRVGWVTWRWVGMHFARAALVTVLLVGSMFVVDEPLVAGDVDLQFAFRLSQGWDLLADITGLFEPSDVAFGDRFQPSEERADVWPEYLEMFLENPIVGVGLGVGWLTNSIMQEPHNLVLELLAETGIVGLLSFLGLIVVVARSGAGMVAAGLVVVAFLPSMTQTVLFEPTWWFVAGLYLSESLSGYPQHVSLGRGKAPSPQHHLRRHRLGWKFV